MPKGILRPQGQETSARGCTDAGATGELPWAASLLAHRKGSCGKWLEKAEHVPNESTALCPGLYFAQSRPVEAAFAKKSVKWSKTEEEDDGLVSVPGTAPRVLSLAGAAAAARRTAH